MPKIMILLLLLKHEAHAYLIIYLIKESFLLATYIRWCDVDSKALNSQSCFPHTLLEALCVQIGNNYFVTLYLVYIPPNSSELYTQFLCDCINTAVSHSDNKCILLGDFNFPRI